MPQKGGRRLALHAWWLTWPDPRMTATGPGDDVAPSHPGPATTVQLTAITVVRVHLRRPGPGRPTGRPEAGGEGIIAWIAQTFLQLVLLSIIIVGQNIAADSSDQRSVNTFKDAEAILSEAIEIQKHLQAQDEQLISALKVALSRVPSAQGSPLPQVTADAVG